MPITQWYAAQQHGGEIRYHDTLVFEYDAFGQLLREQTDTGGYQHSYDVLGNLTATELAGGRRIEYLHYGSGHLQQVNWRDKDQLTVLAEYQRDRLHRETLRSSGQLDNDTGYDVRGRVTHQVARRMNESTFISPVIDKRYHWNNRNQLIERSVSYGQGDGLFTQGHWYYNSYQYDPLGQLTQHLGTLQTEQFLYDEAANLLNVPSQSAAHNQVQHSEKYDYQYDGFGRMAWRRDRGSQDGQRYHYDSEHRIMAVELTQGPIGYERAEYRYDILGRRTEKRLWKASTFGYPTHFTPREPDEVYRFSWVGMQLASEHHSSAPNTTVYHVYNDGSYTPLARIHCFDHAEKQTTEVYYSHCALNGLPEALTNADGQMVWQGQYGLWGNLQRQVWPTGHLSTEQNLRFQGQYFDKETGLHYNTFRYYSPDLGRFTQQDPSGLAGGLNLYQYAPNPLTWVDPLSLSPVSPKTILFSQDSIGPIFSDGKKVNELFHHLKQDPSYINKIEPIREVKITNLPLSIQERLLSQGAHKNSVFSLDNRRLYAAKEAGVNKIPSVWATEADLKSINLDDRFSTKTGGKDIRVRC